ncbi:MAG: LysR family transcriptional regulator [Oleiphilaceae bacterium]|nr:LysR family transcriptional regulator [Oleiphilaceae bacterium]
MDLRALRYFVATVECGSVSGAAQRCYVAQPSITQAINKLEQELECQLLFRHARGVNAGPNGEELYHMAKQLLHQAQKIESHFKQHRATAPIRVHLSAAIGINYVETLLHTLQTHDTQVRIELVSDKENSDINICHHPGENPPKDFIALATEEYVLLAPPNHWLAHQSQFTLEQLDGEALIERRHCENRALFEQAISHLGISFHTVAMVDNEEWARALVASGLGVSIAPIAKGQLFKHIEITPLRIPGMPVPRRTVGLQLNKQLADHTRELIQTAYPESLK